MGHKSQARTSRVTDTHEILGGKALILRTGASGDVWQFRMWVPEEKKYVRKTLKTRDFETAVQRAETLYLQLYSDIASGKKLFGICLGELIEQYLKWRQEDVKGGSITAGRLVTITSQLKHLRQYKGDETRLCELDRQSLYDYAQWRRTHNIGVQDVTLRNEEVTINHMMKYAYRQGYAHFDRFEFPTIKIREVVRRDTFTLEEYDELIKFLRSWTSAKEAPNEDVRNVRLMIKDCILVASNTMLRVGELWQLRWSDISRYENVRDETGRPVVLVTLKVRSETAKNRKSRLITCRGGEYFKRLHNRTQAQRKRSRRVVERNDYVFCGDRGGDRISKKKFYDAWSELMTGIGLDYKKRNVTWYSLRHFGITCRLKAGASVFDVAKIVGTSVYFIEQHYGHFDQSMARTVALKNFVVSKEGIATEEGMGE